MTLAGEIGQQSPLGGLPIERADATHAFLDERRDERALVVGLLQRESRLDRLWIDATPHELGAQGRRPELLPVHEPVDERRSESGVVDEPDALKSLNLRLDDDRVDLAAGEEVDDLGPRHASSAESVQTDVLGPLLVGLPDPGQEGDVVGRLLPGAGGSRGHDQAPAALR